MSKSQPLRKGQDQLHLTMTESPDTYGAFRAMHESHG